MNIYNLLKIGRSTNEIAREFVDKYLRSGSSTTNALRIFINFLISLSVDNESVDNYTLSKYDVILIENLNIEEIFENVGPENIENLVNCEDYDEIVLSMLGYMSSINDTVSVMYKFLRKINRFLKCMQCSQLRGMVDLSTYFCTSFIKGIYDNFCNLSYLSQSNNDIWFNICGEYVALAYIGFTSPYFGYNALDRICHIHEKTLKIFNCDPDFFIIFIKALKFKVVRMGSRILNSLIKILTNSHLYQDDINVFESKLIENFDFIFSMFMQNNTPKLIKLFIILFENLKNLKLAEHQKFDLFEKIMKTDGIKEVGCFFLNQMKTENFNDKEIFFYILSIIKKTENKKKLINVIEIFWDNFSFIRQLDALCIYFIKFEDIDQLCSLSWLFVSITDFLNENHKDYEIEFKNLLKSVPAVLKTQKDKLNFKGVDILLNIVSNINLDYFLCENLGHVLFFDNLLTEILDLCKSEVLLDINMENELFVKKIFDIIDKFYFYETAKSLISDFVSDLILEFFEIIKMDMDCISNELFQRFLILNLEISEAIFHLCGVENINFGNLIILFFKEFTAEGFFVKLSSKYKDYIVSAYAIKIYCDCIYLLEKSIEIRESLSEVKEILKVLCITLIEFVITSNCTIKDVNFVVKSIYALNKLIPVLYQSIEKSDDGDDIVQVLCYYEQTVQLVYQFIFNDSIAWGTTDTEIAREKKLVLQLLIEMHKIYVPASTILWKLLLHTGAEHLYNNELKILIEVLLQNFKSNFVNIFASLLSNINSNNTEHFNPLAVSNIRKIYTIKFPLKAGIVTDTFLNIDGATVLTLLQMVHEKLVSEYGANKQMTGVSEKNLLRGLDSIDESFLEFFKLSPNDEKILLDQVFIIYSNYFHLMSAEEKSSFKKFQEKLNKNHKNA